jgi:hypothetical protein
MAHWQRGEKDEAVHFFQQGLRARRRILQTRSKERIGPKPREFWGTGSAATSLRYLPNQKKDKACQFCKRE